MVKYSGNREDISYFHFFWKSSLLRWFPMLCAGDMLVACRGFGRRQTVASPCKTKSLSSREISIDRLIGLVWIGSKSGFQCGSFPMWNSGTTSNHVQDLNLRRLLVCHGQNMANFCWGWWSSQWQGFTYPLYPIIRSPFVGLMTMYHLSHVPNMPRICWPKSGILYAHDVRYSHPKTF